jgi:hypothetical protein
MLHVIIIVIKLVVHFKHSYEIRPCLTQRVDPRPKQPGTLAESQITKTWAWNWLGQIRATH